MTFGTKVNSGRDEISVVGPTHLSSVDCESFSAAGATKVDGPITATTVSLKGSTSVGGDVEVDEFSAEGSTDLGGDLNATETTVKGSTNVEGDLRTDRLEAKGSAKFEDVSADSVSTAGALSVADLVADEVEIQGVVSANRIDADDVHLVLGDSTSSVGEILGGTVSVERGGSDGLDGFSESDGRLEAETVEGETVSLEHATVKEVTGEKVSLGPGAKVGVVRADELDVDEQATVESTESRNP